MRGSRPAVALTVAVMLAACGGAGEPTVPEAGRVASVALSPLGLTLYEGQSATLAATARNAAGDPVPGAVIRWSMVDTTVARVDAAGNVVARRAGKTEVRATTSSIAGSADVVVRQVPVASVAVSPPQVTVFPGAPVQFAATARDSVGGVLSGRTIVFRTSDAAIATVSDAGIVTAVGSGFAQISATTEGKVGFATAAVVASVDADLARLSAALLTSADPVKAQQDYIDYASRLYATRSAFRSRSVLDSMSTFTFNPVPDSAALRRFAQAIAGRAFTAPAASPPPTGAGRPVSVIFVNGVVPSPTAFARAFVEVNLASVEGLSYSGAAGLEVVPMFNAWWYALPRAGQFACLQGTAGFLVLPTSPAENARDCTGDVGWARVAREFLDAGTGYPDAALADAARLRAMIAARVAAGRKVVVVAHSLGNVLAQRAVNDIAQASPRSLRCVGVVSLAPPRTDDWPEEGADAIQHASVFTQGRDGPADVLLDVAYLARGRTPRATFVLPDAWAYPLPNNSDSDAKWQVEYVFHDVLRGYLYGDDVWRWVRGTVAAQVDALDAGCTGP